MLCMWNQWEFIMLAQMTSNFQGLVSSIEKKQERKHDVSGLGQKDEKDPEALPFFYLGIITVLTLQHLTHGMGNGSSGMVRHPQTSSFDGNGRRALPNSWSIQSSVFWVLPLKSWPDYQMWPRFSSQNKALVFTGGDCSTTHPLQLTHMDLLQDSYRSYKIHTTTWN